MSDKSYEAGENYKYPLIVKKLLVNPLLYSPEQEIIYRDKVRYSYRILNERINRLADGLRKMGVCPGDTVCIFDYDSHRYLECFFAVPMMGAVLHTMNWRLSPDRILYTMNHAEDDVVIIHADFLPLLESVQNELTTVKKIILIRDGENVPECNVKVDIEYENMLRQAFPVYDFPDLDENTKATTFYTTGTTGLPKGVYFSHRQVILHTFSLAVTLGCFVSSIFRSADVYMPLTPMFHAHAWGIPYLAALLGVKQVYPGKYEPGYILNLVEKEKVTFSHCVPTVMHMLINSQEAKDKDLSRWKVVIGGAALPKGLAKAIASLGIKIFASFGMSEAFPVVTISNLKEHMRQWDEDEQLDVLIKPGLPLPLYELEIVDVSGKYLPKDGVTSGELIMRAPWLTESYFKEPGRTKELWRDGWMHGGDAATIDQEGYVQITDRLKDVIKSGGEWVSSLELENYTSQHESVSEAAAVGIPDEKWGERPLVLVVLKPEHKGKVKEEDLKSHLKGFVDSGILPKYGLPDRIEFIEAIPKTSVGKINKVALRELYINKE
ncbi:MAG: Acyl-CoA synthetase (AMP-forming)/AMP-acid ligase II [Desulfotomaculum sp. 46_296]|nr:MAG: Acyl-CoA synthetase (AMP-forming)/AMP-acid ligase II [Desulfotomaculum sp. 46_296]HAU31600.1 long-chain fatty acid--CoA ligase [Desulfotomaculum sp.]